MKSILLKTFLGLSMLSALGGCSKTSESTPPAITKAEQTTISPYLEAKLDSINNTLYCASFQMAWSKMRNQVIKEDIRLTGNPPTARQLNRQLLGNDDVSSGSYVAEAGVLSQELIERINMGLQEKFGDQGGEIFKMPQTAAGDRSIIAYAYLQKNLEFRTEFEKLTAPVSFQANGSSTPVQDTRFKLDEKGAVLKSRAFFMAMKAEAPAPGNAKPRMFIFDKPFLIYMKQKIGKYPYFVLWINNPELMLKK
jgi:hypothetical protein